MGFLSDGVLSKRILSTLMAAKIKDNRPTIGFNLDGLKRFWLYKRLNEEFFKNYS